MSRWDGHPSDKMEHHDKWSIHFGYWFRWHVWPNGAMSCKPGGTVSVFQVNGELDFY